MLSTAQMSLSILDPKSFVPCDNNKLRRRVTLSESKFEIIEAEKAGLELYVLVLKELDLALGYVIYQRPPVGQAEIIIGPKWTRKEIQEMKKVVKNKIGREVSITVSRPGVVRTGPTRSRS